MSAARLMSLLALGLLWPAGALARPGWAAGSAGAGKALPFPTSLSGAFGEPAAVRASGVQGASRATRAEARYYGHLPDLPEAPPGRAPTGAAPRGRTLRQPVLAAAGAAPRPAASQPARRKGATPSPAGPKPSEAPHPPELPMDEETRPSRLGPAPKEETHAPGAAALPAPVFIENWTPAESCALEPDAGIFKRYPPMESGPGILVCDPVAAMADPDAADLGRGCARWLHLMVGGQGYFGKTPHWQTTERGWSIAGKPNARLSPADARALPRILGVTHAALGEIRGSPDHLTLTYQWWRLSEQKPIGTPLSLAGPREVVVAGLPELAARLCRTLGIAEPRVPPALGETAEDLRALGHMPWTPGEGLPQEDQARLQEFERRILVGGPAEGAPAPLLGAFYALYYRGDQGDLSVEKITAALVERLPANSLLFDSAAFLWLNCPTGNGEDFPTRQLEEDLARFSRSYPFHSARALLHTIVVRRDDERKEWEMAVRCAPHSTAAWLELCVATNTLTDTTQRKLYSASATGEDADTLSRLRNEALGCALRVTALDPELEDGWYRLAMAALAAGEGGLADEAIWKALAMSPQSHRLLVGAAQIYRPMWFEGKAKMARVGEMAIAASEKWTPQQRAKIEIPLVECGLRSVAERMARTVHERGWIANYVTWYQKWGVKGEK